MKRSQSVRETVLIVDDVDEIRELLARLLTESQKLSVRQARDGWAARAEVSRERPALLLLDELLPGESSLDLLREWSTLGIPVVLMTGMSEKVSSDRLLPPEAQSRLVKPDLESRADQAAWSERVFEELCRVVAKRSS